MINSDKDKLAILKYKFNDFNYNLHCLESCDYFDELLKDIFVKISTMLLYSYGEPDKNLNQKSQFLTECIANLETIKKHQVDCYIEKL